MLYDFPVVKILVCTHVHGFIFENVILGEFRVYIRVWISFENSKITAIREIWICQCQNTRMYTRVWISFENAKITAIWWDMNLPVVKILVCTHSQSPSMHTRVWISFENLIIGNVSCYMNLPIVKILVYTHMYVFLLKTLFLGMFRSYEFASGQNTRMYTRVWISLLGWF